VDVLLAQLRVVLAHARVARSRLERAASDLERDGDGDRRVPDPRRLPRFAATIEQDLIMARRTRESATSSRNLPPPSSPCCGASLPVSRGARSTRGSALAEYVKTHTRELCRNLDVTSPADVLARATTLGLRDLSESPG